MSAAALLARLQDAGATFRAEGGELVVRAPAGRLGQADVMELRERKGRLLSILGGDRCLHCEDAIDWRRPTCVAFGDGTAAHLGCYEEAEAARQAARRRRSTDARQVAAREAAGTARGGPRS